MTPEAAVATTGAVVIGVVDALIVARVLRAYGRSRRRPHLVIAAGIAASYVAVIGACLVLGAHGDPGLASGSWWTVARSAGLLGPALAYGLVGVFAAEAFARRQVTKRLSFVVLLALVAVAAAALVLEAPAVATPATMRWSLRVPFVALSLAGSLGGGLRALRLTRAYRAARSSGRPVDPVALGRMHVMAQGFVAMAIGQLALIGFAHEGRFASITGLVMVSLVMLGGLGFALSCVATWATPAWLRTRWEAA